MNETLRLDLNFITENGKTRKITINRPAPGLTETQVKEAMQAISDAEIFVSDGVLLYEDIRSARYVTTGVDEVFDEEE